MTSRPGRLSARLFFALLLALASTAHADSFTVNNGGSDGPDINPGDGACATINGFCTLEAAIGEANQRTGAHTISFSVTGITLTSPLPLITAPVTIDGVNAGAIGGRVDLDGNNLGGLQLSDAPTVIHANGARDSTIENLVVRNFNGSGISLIGHGYTVTNCYVGVSPLGDVASPNTNTGIDITGTITPPSIPDLPGNFDSTPAQIAAQLITLFATIPPNTITLNTISGNRDTGIRLHGDKTALNVITANFIGTSPDGMSAIPNGNAGGGNHPGIRLDANAYANVIGPGNVISGNSMDTTDNGIDAISAAVEFPNFIAGNSIGLGADATGDLGNGGSGIKTDTFPEVDGNAPDNPTNLSLVIVGNIVSDNKGANAGGPDSANGPNAGISITGASARVKVTGNLIGLGSFGGVLSLAPDHGNAGDGIFVSTSDHEIGGPLAADFNVIAANARHGIMLAGSGTHGVIVRNNFVGVPDPTMLDVLDLGNGADGIHIDRASTNTIGGSGSLDDNVIAANARHGVAMRNGSAGNGWANLLQRNQIYANGGLGIDLERNLNAADPIPDPLDPDPNTNYANFGQNQPWICSQQPTDPPACGASALPSYDGTSTTLRWTLTTSPNATIRVEFFARTSTAQTFLGEEAVTTDASGLVSGAGCTAGVCTSSVGSGIDTTGGMLEMTATDVTVRDVPPVGDGMTGPSNNTSEFSNAVAVAQPGELEFSAPVFTVGEAGVTATITVNRVNGVDGAVGVDFTTADGTAQQPADYTTASSPPPLSWADQDNAPKVFTVPVVGDSLYEPGGNETVLLSLGNPTGGAVLGAQSTATLEIVDDDLQPTLAIDDVSQLEGDAGTSAFAFTITLSNASAQTVSVVANTTPGSASAGTDYNPVVGQSITFNPGETVKTLSVDVIGDTLSESPSETFTVDLSSPVNASIADGQGLGTIVDDDAGAAFTIDSVSVNEGNAGTTALVFTVTRSQSGGAASVDFATADGSATVADGDYVANSGTLNFADGVAVQPITVLVNGDTKFEGTENLVVNLSNPSAGTTIGQGVGTGTISNDDAQPSVSIGDLALPEGNAGTTAFAFPVTLSNASDQTITVIANTADGSATVADSDYAPVANQTITFSPGQTVQSLLVDVMGDTTSESNESFSVDLSAPIGASVADGQGVGTIIDDDSGSVFTIGNATANEGNSGTTAFAFTVTRSQTSGAATVDFSTADGSATTAGADYAAASGTLAFADGIATQTITVAVTGDVIFEGDETFSVVLSNPSSGTTIGQGTGTGTITNDDTQPAISIADVSQAEGNSGTTAFDFAITLSNPSSMPVTVVADTSDGSAGAPADYASVVSQTITFNPGTTTQTLTVGVAGDTTPETNETFTVDLSAPSNATIADGQATGTIVDDDSGPVFTIGNATATEGNAGTTALTFTVTRSQSPGSASVDFATSDGTATVSDNDYAAISGTLAFADNVAQRTITVNANGDTVFESNETFTVTLSNASAGTTIGQATGTGTITNDDAQPSISVADVSMPEGDAGSTAFDFAVTLSNASSQTVTVVANTAAVSATSGTDFTPIASQTVTFAPGTTSQTVSVGVIGDTVAESDETFRLELTNPVNASIADPQADGTIIDDDSGGGAGALFSIAAASIVEGSSGTSALTFTVTRTDTSASASVDYSTADGSATAGSDYIATSGTLNFAVGVATATFTVDIVGDALQEGNETFTVVLSNPVGGTIAAGQGVGTATIFDDDSVVGGGAGPVATPALDVRGLMALVTIITLIGAAASRRTRRQRS